MPASSRLPGGMSWTGLPCGSGWIATGLITMRNADGLAELGWQTLGQPPAKNMIDLAA
jgi:hypothetical protein